MACKACIQERAEERRENKRKARAINGRKRDVLADLRGIVQRREGARVAFERGVGRGGV
jgi:hypothetical protein